MLEQRLMERGLSIREKGQVAFSWISLLQFVLLSVSPRTPSCDPFLGNKCQGQSHECQPSQATIKLASKVNAVRNWGNLPWLPFNKKKKKRKKKLLHNPERQRAIMQSAQCRRVQGQLSRLALQGLLEHIQLALCHCEPLHSFDNLQSVKLLHGPCPHPADIFKELLVFPCDARRVIWFGLPSQSTGEAAKAFQVSTERNRRNAGWPEPSRSLMSSLARKWLNTRSY